ncbi:hypothetical protein SAMN05216428_10193 [Nitrosospira sp. Nsp11]|nr:hypothetical protein SAMN05216428_10193 [Nitrosospira sp. Nsp11]
MSQIKKLPPAPRRPDLNNLDLTDAERDDLNKKFCEEADVFLASLPRFIKEVNMVVHRLESFK